MSIANIILWTISLTLAVIGIGFGIIASISATKANNKIQNIITSTFATEEAQKLFFDNIKDVIKSNRKVVRYLKTTKEKTFLRYSSTSAEARLTPMSNNSYEIIKETEFKDIALAYSKIKSELDQSWFEIINDTSKLITEDKISKSTVNQLIKYHETVVQTCSTILKNYSRIIASHEDVHLTRESRLKPK